MILRERRTDRGLLVSVCDSDLLGETFENGEVTLTVTEEFYGGEEADEVDEETVVERLAHAEIANIVGTRSVEIAVEAGIVDRANVLDVGETRHAQLVRL